VVLRIYLETAHVETNKKKYKQVKFYYVGGSVYKIKTKEDITGYQIQLFVDNRCVDVCREIRDNKRRTGNKDKSYNQHQIDNKDNQHQAYNITKSAEL